MAATPEGRVKKEVRDWLEYQGFVKMGENPTRGRRFLGYYYMPVPHPFQVAGIADFVLCCKPKGRTIWIEAKAPGGKVSGPQEERHKEVIQCGGLVWVVGSLSMLTQCANDAKLFEVFYYPEQKRAGSPQ